MPAVLVFGTALSVATAGWAAETAVAAVPAVGPANGPANGRRVTPDNTPVATRAPSASRVGTSLAWHARSGAPQLLWTGFRAQARNGEVWLQTSAAVEIQPGHTPGPDMAVFVLKHCRAPRRTDRLPLETRYFKSPVTRVTVRRRGRDLEVTVSLRGAGAVAARKEAGPDGSWFWVLRFPSAPEESRTTTAAATP